MPYLNYLVKSWCRHAGLKGNYGSPTLRKTFGYIQFTHFKTDILMLMRMFNHPSPQRMLSYFNITDEEFTSLMLNHPSPKQALSYIGIQNSSLLARQTTGLTEEKTDTIKTNFRERMSHIYFEYQKSYLWSNVVNAVIERDKKTCQGCGKQPQIGIAHHTSYKNWGKGNNEEIRDCVYLCKKCHNARHRKNGDELTPFWASRNYDPDLDRIEEEDVAKLFIQEI